MDLPIWVQSFILIVFMYLLTPQTGFACMLFFTVIYMHNLLLLCIIPLVTLLLSLVGDATNKLSGCASCWDGVQPTDCEGVACNCVQLIDKDMCLLWLVDGDGGVWTFCGWLIKTQEWGAECGWLTQPLSELTAKEVSPLPQTGVGKVG